MATQKKIVKKKTASVPSSLLTADSGDAPEERQPALPPISVIPLSDERDADGEFILTVPPVSSTTRAVKYLTAQADAGRVQVPPELIDALAKSAVDPRALALSPITRQRVDDGWFYLLETRLFTPMIDVSLANDRWVAEAVYAADPSASAAGTRFTAVPMPESHTTMAALVYSSNVTELIQAAELNYSKVLSENPQEVGRRLIEQAVTLTPTIVESDGSDPMYVWTTADGNCRTSSALDRLDVPVEWLPSSLRNTEPYKDMVDGTAVKLTPTVLMNLAIGDKRILTRKLAKRAVDRLKVPAKADGSRGALRDRAERDAAAAALNALTVPTRVVVGWVDDDSAKGMTRFASAMRALLVQMNVEAKPIDEAAREGVRAEEIVEDLFDAGVITEEQRDVLVGRREITSAMKTLGLDPKLPDLRAALVMQVMTGSDEATRTILRQRLRGDRQLYPQHRQKPTVELVLRSYTASLADDLPQVRRAFESNIIWGDLVTHRWSVFNANTDEKVDALTDAAIDQVAAGGPAVRLLGVLGMIALVTSGYLFAPGASAMEHVGGQEIDRGGVGPLVGRLVKHEWGLRLLGDAVKRVRAGETTLRTVDADGELVDAPTDWSPVIYNAHLRLMVKNGSVAPIVIPGSAEENVAWTKFLTAVRSAKEAMDDFRNLREENNNTAKLPWSDVDAAVSTLRWLASYVPNSLSQEPEPEFDR